MINITQIKRPKAR